MTASVTTAWPPPCPVCAGSGFTPDVPGSEELCESCWGEGDAVEWTCHDCSAVIDVAERPARVATVPGLGGQPRTVYVCGICESAPVLPGMEVAR